MDKQHFRIESFKCCLYMLCLFLFTGSVTDKPPGPPNSGRKGELRSAVSLQECECMKETEREHKFKMSFDLIFFPPI